MNSYTTEGSELHSYCTACHRTFDSLAAYRRHRTGRFVPNTRRCRNEDEMRRVYLSLRADVWHLATPFELLQLQGELLQLHRRRATATASRSKSS